MINQFAHTESGVTIQFPANPIRGNAESVERQQISAFDSNGEYYCYERNSGYRRVIPQVYTNVPPDVVRRLLLFDQAREGNKDSFTWFDHDGNEHTVRFSGNLTYTETGPDRYRVTVTVSEEIPGGIIPASFVPTFDRRTGLMPIWILRLVINGVTYDLSDSVYTFPAGMGGGFTETLPWVGQWGETRESISGSIGEILISDFAMTLFADQSRPDNIYKLAKTYPLEDAPATLYLWLDGLTNASLPSVRAVGYINNVDIPDETQVNIVIEDESTRMQQYIGTRISSESYPLCDPDEVGKMIPIPFGTVTKGATRCVDSGWVSSIVADISAAQTSFTVSEVPAYSLSGKVISVDDEQMLIAAVNVPSGTNLARVQSGWPVSVLAINYDIATDIQSTIDGNLANGVGVIGTLYGDGNRHYKFHVAFPTRIIIDELDLYFPQTGTPHPRSETVVSDWAPPTIIVTYSTDNGATWGAYHYYNNANYEWFRVQLPAGIEATNVAFELVSGPRFVGGGYTDSLMISEVEVFGRPVATSNKTLTVTRGYNGTIPNAHTKGSVVIEKKISPLVYLCADCGLDAIGTIMARIRGVFVDITSDCNKYLGTPGNQLAAYPGKAAITIPDYARVEQRISLALQGDVTGDDPGHTHNASSSGGTTTQDQDATGADATMGQISLTWDAIHNQNRFPSEQIAVAKAVTFPAPGGTPYAGTMSATVTVHLPSTGGFWYLTCGGKRITPVYGNGIDGWSPAITHDATSIQGNVLALIIGAWPTGQTASLTAMGEGTISAAHRSVTYSTSSTLVVSQSGSGVVVTNTLALTGNSISDIMIGDAVVVDKIRNISAPADVIGNLLATYCNDTTLAVSGTIPAGYSFNGELVEYKKAVETIDYLAFQCRSYFRRTKGVSKLIVRELNPTLTGTIAACCLTDEGIKDCRLKKTTLTDVINRIKVLYSRDWTNSNKSLESYKQATSPITSAESIRRYGEREMPDLFMFDFVSDYTMATDLGTFYLAMYAFRKWRASFPTYLYAAQYEFGDIVRLLFEDGLTGVVVEAGDAPGGTDRMDRINFVVEALPELPGLPE